MRSRLSFLFSKNGIWSNTRGNLSFFLDFAEELIVFTLRGQTAEAGKHWLRGFRSPQWSLLCPISRLMTQTTFFDGRRFNLIVGAE